MFHVQLFKNRMFALGNLAGLVASIGRGGLQFMLIIWLQGIWLPLHGYDYQSTPLWAGIYLLPLTVGFLIAGPLSGMLSDRYGVRIFATGGLLVVAATMVGLMLIPVNFPYWVFALLLTVNGIGSGLFSAPNTSAVMGAVPASQRGAASGMRATFFNSGNALSIGIFFSLMIVGLASTLPEALRSGLTGQGVPAGVADQVAGLPPVGSLFAAFLGFNPIQELLAPSGVLNQLPPDSVANLTGTTFFPQLISGPFQHGLFVVFMSALVMTLVGALASALQGKEPRVAAEIVEPLGDEPVGPAFGPVGAGPVGPAFAEPLPAVRTSRGVHSGAGNGNGTGNGTNGNGTGDGSGNGGPDGDQRDRLLGVLLADPDGALRAVRDLESTSTQLEQLTDSVRVQRRELAGATRRLREAGLSPDQVARLAAAARAQRDVPEDEQPQPAGGRSPNLRSSNAAS